MGQGGTDHSEQTKSPALRFGCREDALNYANKVLENGIDWSARKNRRITDRYEEGEVDVVVECAATLDGTKYHLLFGAVPNRSENGHAAGDPRFFAVNAADPHSIGGEPCAPGADGNERGMLRIGEFVHGPKGVIPTLVRLEGPKKRNDVTWQILAPSGDNVRESGSGVSKRKVARFRSGFPAQSGAGISGLVESVPQVLDGVMHEVSDGVGNARGHLDLVKLSDAITVHLNDNGVWAFLLESVASLVQITNVFLCSRELPLGALERIGGGHEQKT